MHTICPFITDRSIEQIKLDMCYNDFAGNIVTCGATFDYAWDGATHHAYTDLAMLRMLPNMEVLHLGSKREVEALIRSQYKNVAADLLSALRLSARRSRPISNSAKARCSRTKARRSPS